MKKAIIYIIYIFCSITTYAYNLRQISSRDGLSNSSVTCLFQDDKRFLWIGTYDGLNMYNSRKIHIYKPDIKNQNTLSSNIIKDIIETDSIYLWINTKWGLNKLSQLTNKIEETYDEFGENSHMAKDSHDNFYISGKPDVLSFYSKTQKKFINLPTHPGMVHDNVSNLIIDSHDTIWIHNQGKLEKYTLSFNQKEVPQLIRHKDFNYPYSIRTSFYSEEKIIIVDNRGNISYIDSTGTHFITNPGTLINENGKIGSIIFDNKDLLIGFKTNGLIRLDASRNYKVEWMEIDCGVFSLYKDTQQDIVWIGTDGQGVYAWTKDEYTYNNITLNQLPVSKKRPIRAIYTDSQNTLWLGTKENGIIKIKDYDQTAINYSATNVKHLTTKDGLTNNAIFAFTPGSSSPILWIGSDGPELNYYSYKDDRIHTIKNPTRIKIAGVHSILEKGDSLLWVGSGSSLLKIAIQSHNNNVSIKNIRPYNFHIPNKVQYNQIYSICAENDSILWIGMRGNGLIRLNTITENYRLINFTEKNGIVPMNDILCIHQDRNHQFWLGTSYGLTKITILPDGEIEYKNYSENEGLPNNTIHGILEDDLGNLWLSSNTGIILFNPYQNTFQNLNHKTGLKTIEFSDNAYYWDPTKKRCFFGGVDGLVWIKNNPKEKKRFLPEIYFTQLRIFNQEYNISEFLEERKDEKTIVLNHHQNFFAVSFVAVDYINGENSQYSYKLENFNNVWMDTRSHEAQFTNIPPGHYILKVKYNDGINNSHQLAKSIHIFVRPPWYQTIYAYIFYSLIIIGCILGMIRYIRWKYEQRKNKITQKLDAKYKEEMYEEKLRFFTNITHEFCTPLTLIYGPCERILNYEHTDSFINKYIQIIKSNSERLNSLIQEVIDFRRMETGNQICHIQKLDISVLSNEIIDSFSELAEQNNIFLQTEVERELIWNSDNNCFSKVLNNLISNAFKYTPKKGVIRISVRQIDSNLQIKVYNTGKGICQESIPLIFNRYIVLDNIKENSIKGLSSRNGLGLAICQSMVKLLQGEIQIESEVDKYAEFIVTLPLLEISLSTSEKEEEKNNIQADHIQSYSLKKWEQPIALSEGNKSSSTSATILVIEDNKELLWMLKDILSDEYKVLMASNGEEGLNLLKQQTPELIITDIMMPKVDGITLTKLLKGNKHTLHIPLVILSAKNTTDEKIEGIECGADAYIPKPFNSQYLKTVVRHLIKKQKDMEEYYNSSASIFEFSGGQLIQKEDKEFLQTAIQMIEKNIDDASFGPDELATALQTSSRNLYRKFKALDQLPPKDFIKEQRISHAAKLLLTTQLTIQEIMYKTAFLNRSHFYKEFAKRYNQTPKEYRDSNKQKDDSLN
ncbi:hybrid sensor histidine kinase/response regulator transcription factor [Bacteroides bouchesdurhonensis]